MHKVGQCEFEVESGRLIVADREVPLDRSSAAILARLVAHIGNPVSKDDLLKAGWPGRMVHENSLAKSIGRLRQALGNDGWRIEAAYGHGYRLVPDETEALLAQPAVPRRRRPRLFIALAAIAAACALSASYVYWPRSAESPLKIGEAHDVMGRILWVDDHPENNVREKRFLEQNRLAVYNVTTSDEALKLLAMYRYDAVVSDMGRNGNPLAGLELVETMRERGDHTPFYLYTILPSQAQRDLLTRHGGQGVAVTPEGLYSYLLPQRSER